MRKAKLRELLESWDGGAWGEPDNTENGVSVLRSTNFREGGNLSFDNQAVLAIDERIFTEKRLQQGDILLERSGGGPLQPVGRVAAFWGCETSDRIICGNFISRLVPNKDVVDSNYLRYALLSWHISGQTEKFQTATTGIRNLQMKQYLDNELLLPERVEEQSKIAHCMSVQLAEVETARQAAVDQLRDAAVLKSKALESIFAGISKRKAIGTVANVQSGYAFKSDTFKTSGVRLLRNANILPGQVYWEDQVFLSEEDSKPFKSYELNDGDVLISLDRPIISSGIKVARVGAVDLPALLVQRVGRFLIDPDQLDADYLYAYLQTQMFISAISGHDQSLGVPHISPTQVENVEIPLPDVMTQKKLSKQLNEVAREWQVIRSSIQAQLTDFTTLPNAILAQAFES